MPTHSTVRGRAFLRTLNTTTLVDPAATCLPAPFTPANADPTHDHHNHNHTQLHHYHHPMKKRARPAACFTFVIFIVALIVFAFFIPFVNKFTRDLITSPSSVPILSPADPTRPKANTLPIVTRQIEPDSDAADKLPVSAHASSGAGDAASNTDAVSAAGEKSDKTSLDSFSSSPRKKETSVANMSLSASQHASELARNADSLKPQNQSWFHQGADEDDTGLVDLVNHLNLSNSSLLNYFHMHKTGGVTTKTLLISLLQLPQNAAKRKSNGEPLRYLDTCYTTPTATAPSSTAPPSSAGASASGNGSTVMRDAEWRCDFRQIRTLPAATRANTDVLMGHQYWVNGCDTLFGEQRDVRFLSIFRHPLPRKLSFYYHFFVRNAGRREDGVSADELVAFVLGERSMRGDARARDAGPNYYASRFLSDGVAGFSENAYGVGGSGGSSGGSRSSRNEGDGGGLKDAAAAKAAIAACGRRIDERYVMVGLQTQPVASQCMLGKVVRVFAHAHGMDDLAGSERITRGESRLNSGSYAWTARRVWEVMNETQRAAFKRVERVDVAIYERVRRRFVEDVRRFRCDDGVDAKEWEEDVYE